MSATCHKLRLDSNNVIRYEDFTDATAGTVITGATVTLTIRNEADDADLLAATAMADQGGGLYLVSIVPTGPTFTNKQRVILVVDANGGAGLVVKEKEPAMIVER